MILQLDPPFPLYTPRGNALAHFIIDYGAEHSILWVCFIQDTGECWTYSNDKIRAQKNITMGREYTSPFYEANSVAFPEDFTNA